jgi:hypothetical protein
MLNLYLKVLHVDPERKIFLGLGKAATHCSKPSPEGQFIARWIEEALGEGS